MTTKKTRRTRSYTIAYRCDAPTGRFGRPCMRPTVNPTTRCTMHHLDHPPKEAPATAPTAVDHPAHYNHGTIEAITVIEDWSLNFNLGNAVKYISRADHKGNAVEDLRKALWYIQRELDRRNTVGR